MSILIKNRPDLTPVNKDLKLNAAKLQKSMEKLSSGLRINSASDAPSELYMAQKINSQVTSIDQSIRNTEVDISMMQVADSSLSEIFNLLNNMRQLSVQAANEAVNDRPTLDAIQQEYERITQSIDNIVRETSFGSRKLIDGSAGTTALTTGKNLEFVRAGENTRLPQSDEPIEVIINQNATRSLWVAEDSIDEDIAAEGVTLKISENGRTAVYKTKEGDNSYSIQTALQREVERSGLDVSVLLDNEKLVVQHNQFGSQYGFQVYSDYDGVLSSNAEEPNEAVRGFDVEGYVGIIKMTGEGQTMYGPKGTELEGLVLRYAGTEGEYEGESSERVVGRIYMENNSLVFQTGPNRESVQGISINALNSSTLGRGITTENGFGSLKEVDLRMKSGGRDAMVMLDKAIQQVNILRSEIGAVQKHGLETQLRHLQVSRENLNAAESVIRDTDYAQEVSKTLRFSLMQNNQMALAAQSNKNLFKLDNLLGT